MVGMLFVVTECKMNRYGGVAEIFVEDESRYRGIFSIRPICYAL